MQHCTNGSKNPALAKLKTVTTTEKIVDGKLYQYVSDINWKGMAG